MKTEFNEWGEENIEIKLIPETIEEFAKLLRYSKNASAEKPRVYFYFSIKTTPKLSINLRKYKKSVQRNSITPYNK